MSLHFNAKPAERSAAPAYHDPLLSIRWETDGRPNDAARMMRDSVRSKVEALLDASGLFIEDHGITLGDGTVEITFAVADYETARDVIWSSLTEAETANGCEIFERL